MKKNKPKLTLSKLKAPKRLSTLKVPKLARKKQGAEADTKLTEAIQNLPRITNETVAEHREEVLSSARKYIYPLSHSKRRVVSITVTLLITAVVAFFAYCGVAIYKLKSSSTFMYGVSQVIPFPVAKAGSSWVSYQSYLFELRHTIHYYQTQQKEDFNSGPGKKHMAQLQQQTLAQVINDAYVKQLAKKNHVSVSSGEVDDQVTLVREQNRLGSSDQVFKDVLSEFWGWTVTDFKTELKQQLLAQKLVAKLDTGTNQRAQSALAALNKGADFATLASQVSDDTTTKPNGGDYGLAITQSTSDIAPQVTGELFKLKPGQHSDIINTGYALEIDKVNSIDGAKVHASHITFTFKPLSTYLNPVKANSKVHAFIKVQS